MIDENTPLFENGGEKIKAEAEKWYTMAHGKESEEMMKAQMTPIIQYITEKCETDTEYNALVLQSHKTWKRCYDFMLEKAREMATTGSKGLLVEGITVLKWIDAYYRQADKSQFEKEAKEKAQILDKKQKSNNKKNEIEGQVSLFEIV